MLKASDGLLGHGTGIVNVNGKKSILQFRKMICEMLRSEKSDAWNSIGSGISTDSLPAFQRRNCAWEDQQRLGIWYEK